MTRLFPLLVLAACVAFGLPDSAAQTPLDARLTGYAYPHPVATLAFREQGLDLEMAYMDVQPEAPNGRTVVLLHGKNFSGAYWADTIERLGAEGFRVVVPDQVGFGKSSKPTDFQYSFHALATHTARLLDTLGVDRAAVVGHSMGGMLATRFALMHPERTERLALVNPIGLEDWQRAVPYLPVDGWTAEELAKEPAGVKTYMQAAYFGGEWRPAYDPLLEIQQGWIAGPDWPRLARVSALTYDMIFTQPVVHAFGDLDVPTLLVIGQRDRTALRRNAAPPAVRDTLGDYPRLGRRAAAAIPDAQLVEMDDVGHAPQVEAFDAYIGALTAFLTGP